MNIISHIHRTKRYRFLLRIGGIRPYLTTSATQVLVQSLVISHVDYINAVRNAVEDVYMEKKDCEYKTQLHTR